MPDTSMLRPALRRATGRARGLLSILLGVLVAPATGPTVATGSPERMLPLPPRPHDAPTASAIIEATAHLPVAEREARWVTEILAGNVPAHLRRLVRVSPGGAHGGAPDRWVMSDYLAIGSDDDWVRLPLTGVAALEIARALEAELPTPELIDAVWAGADERLEPIALAPRDEPSTLPDVQRVDRRDTVAAFLTHHRLIEAARLRHGTLVAGHKKDVVQPRQPGRVTLYGWHRRDGRPIQPESSVHSEWYVDYSHGVRLVWSDR